MSIREKDTPKVPGTADQFEGVRNPTVSSAKCPRCSNYRHWARNCPTRGGIGGHSRPERQQDHEPVQKREAEVKCYRCNGKGHLAYQCSSLYCDKGCERTESKTAAIQAGTINGLPCKILLDTGTTQSLFRADFVTKDVIVVGAVPIRCIHGDAHEYPVAPIEVEIGGQKAIVHAAVSRTLPEPAVLGWDAPTFLQKLPIPQQQLEERVGIGPIYPSTQLPTYLRRRLRRKRRREECEGFHHSSLLGAVITWTVKNIYLFGKQTAFSLLSC